MTATSSVELPAWMAEQLSQASPDLLRQMVQIFAEALMSDDADAVCGAYGQRSLSEEHSQRLPAAWRSHTVRVSRPASRRRRTRLPVTRAGCRRPADSGWPNRGIC